MIKGIEVSLYADDVLLFLQQQRHTLIDEPGSSEQALCNNIETIHYHSSAQTPNDAVKHVCLTAGWEFL